MADELLDLVNRKDEVIGEVWKSQAHKNPSLIHREIAVAVFIKQDEVLLQQRSMKKITSPGLWKITAAGHVGKGENPGEAAKREVHEELGFYIIPKFYKKIFARRENKEARFFWVYYAILSKKPKLKLNKSEVMDARWVKIKDLEKFSKMNDYDLSSVSHKIIMALYKRFK